MNGEAQMRALLREKCYFTVSLVFFIFFHLRNLHPVSFHCCEEEHFSLSFLGSRFSAFNSRIMMQIQIQNIYFNDFFV